jgi:FixJ family two-component response regulator
MPVVNGFAVQPRLARAVIVITGHDAAEIRDRALTCGAPAFLGKPLDGRRAGFCDLDSVFCNPSVRR